MDSHPFECLIDLPGWKLHFALMKFRKEREMGTVMQTAGKGAYARLKKLMPEGSEAENPTIVKYRNEIAGLCPGPIKQGLCSESMLRDILKRQSPMWDCLSWDFLSLLTIHTLAPWGLFDAANFTYPLVFRNGEKGEIITGSCGEVDCEGLPILADSKVLLGSPFVYPKNENPENIENPAFVCFMPATLARKINPKSHVGRINWTTWAYEFEIERAVTCN